MFLLDTGMFRRSISNWRLLNYRSKIKLICKASAVGIAAPIVATVSPDTKTQETKTCKNKSVTMGAKSELSAKHSYYVLVTEGPRDEYSSDQRVVSRLTDQAYSKEAACAIALTIGPSTASFYRPEQRTHPRVIFIKSYGPIWDYFRWNWPVESDKTRLNNVVFLITSDTLIQWGKHRWSMRAADVPMITPTAAACDNGSTSPIEWLQVEQK